MTVQSRTAAGLISGPLSGRQAIVIGGGFGGLSTACYLAQAGASVRLLEKNEQVGGRASRLEDQGFVWDMGPSWYLMPDAFARFFGHFGKAPEDYYPLERLDPHYRIFFKGGQQGDAAEQVDITGDRAAMRALFERYETGAGAALDRYLAKSRATYERAMPGFVYTDRPRLRDFMTLDVARQSRGLALLGTMDRFVARYFQHPKLRQIIQYSLVFLGGAPANTPALYHLMGHVDFNLGVFYPQGGGIGAVIDALVSLATELGVEIELGQEVTAIEPVEPFGSGGNVGSVGNEGSGNQGNHGNRVARTPVGRAPALQVRTQSGDRHVADIVVSNADYRHTEEALLAPKHRQHSPRYWRRRVWAPSAYLLYLGVAGDLPALAHHTLVLPEDWEPHFEGLFKRPAWPEDPAYYLCVPSKTDASVAPPGHSNLFVLVPIAAGLEDGPETRARYREQILDDIALSTGEDLRDRIVVEHDFCVSDFAARYHAAEGSALGLAHTLSQSAFARPARRSKKLPGLYFAGSYTTPGIGMPMCLISGEHTAAAIVRDFGG
jgi:phytoene desaturase